MTFKEGKWARQIIDLQNEDGSWGTYFHTMAVPVKKTQLTTEQALRRLWILGFDKGDRVIKRTLNYMRSCLLGERKVDDYSEITHDWPLFTQLMLSAWVRVFDSGDHLANSFSKRWAKVIEASFQSQEFDESVYLRKYADEFGKRTRGARELDPTSFYHVVLLRDMLSSEIEAKYLEHILAKPDGVYYVYANAVSQTPKVFASKETSRYLTLLLLLSEYGLFGMKFGFIRQWINANKDETGQWDLGIAAKDGVIFPRSDSWRTAADRAADCTDEITLLLNRLDKL